MNHTQKYSFNTNQASGDSFNRRLKTQANCSAAQAAWRERPKGAVPSQTEGLDGTERVSERTPEGSGPQRRGGMRPKPNFIYLLLMIFLSSGLKAQDQSGLISFHKYQHDSLYFRWSPRNAAEWQKHLKTGYILQKFEGSKLVLESEPIVPTYIYNQPYFQPDVEYYSIINSLFNIDQVEEEYVKETFPPEQFTKEEVLISRLVLINFYISRNYDFILRAGMGFADNDIKKGTNYKYIIKAMADPELRSDTILFNTDRYTAAPAVPLEAEWGNRKVKLRWNTHSFKGYYYAYTLEKSEDGILFSPLEDDIIINPMDTSELEIFHQMEWSDDFENNTDLRYYRLYGHDYFGHKSEVYSEVKGQGRHEIGLSPTINESEQLPGNLVHLKWSILDQFAGLVKSWRIYVGTGWDGPYVPDTLGLPAGNREIKRPIPFDAAYFRVVAVDEYGREYSSFPRLVMSLDTIPPAVPEEITFEIDSMGVLNLKWKSNEEKDFLGYKVFSSYDTTANFILRHEYFLDKPEFRDSIALKTELKFVYYKLISVDERNNRSAFSEIIRVPIPDKLAPTEPQFYEFFPGKGMIFLRWHPSPSEDVVKQSLYRRATDSETGWRLIREWTLSDMAFEYLDKEVLAFEDYAYILNVTDAGGQISEPSTPVILHAFPDYSTFPLNDFRVERENEEVAKISFEFPANDIFRVDVYKNKTGEKPFLWRAVDDGRKELRDDEIKAENQYQYQVKVVFKDGTQTEFSELKNLERR
jgi:hypothetical protein